MIDNLFYLSLPFPISHIVSRDLVSLTASGKSVVKPGGPLPVLVRAAGRPAEIAWDTFFAGRIRNERTRAIYERAVRRFLLFAGEQGRKGLHEILPGDVARYIAAIAPEKVSISLKKQHLAGIRKFFNIQVEHHVCLINPAASVETERLSVIEGKTPIITFDQAFNLYASIDRNTLAGKRDTAVLATLNFTGARAGAVANLDIDDLQEADGGWSLRFVEKYNKERAIPVSHDLQAYLVDWIRATRIHEQPKRRDPVTGRLNRRPLFRSLIRGEQRLAEYVPERRDPLTGRLLRRERGRMTGLDVNRMIKRRLAHAGLPLHLRPHSFRVALANDFEDQGEPLDVRQHFLGHSDPRVTQVYSRRKQRVSRNLVERIRVGRVK